MPAPVNDPSRAFLNLIPSVSSGKDVEAFVLAAKDDAEQTQRIQIQRDSDGQVTFSVLLGASNRIVKCAVRESNFEIIEGQAADKPSVLGVLMAIVRGYGSNTLEKLAFYHVTHDGLMLYPVDKIIDTRLTNDLRGLLLGQMFQKFQGLTILRMNGGAGIVAKVTVNQGEPFLGYEVVLEGINPKPLETTNLRITAIIQADGTLKSLTHTGKLPKEYDESKLPAYLDKQIIRGPYYKQS